MTMGYIAEREERVPIIFAKNKSVNIAFRYCSAALAVPANSRVVGKKGYGLGWQG